MDLPGALLYVTVDDNIIFSSEAGVIDLEPCRIREKGDYGRGMFEVH